MGPKKKSRLDDSDSGGNSSEEEDLQQQQGEEEVKFSQPGSITRLKFINFMQYNEVEFKCGPNLNVIIGPNGSGKSSIVNGICLGLAGKPNVLGRASNISDFIQFGSERATVEVELYQPDQDNVIIVRQFDRNNKSNWTINGKKSGIREVERKVAELRIQVDNLCQFLPQDKVHDFSRLDSKGLLNSTVDAVGDVSLKEQHAQLKELQKSMSEGEELYERKQQMLAEQLEKCRRLEEEVKAFDEKKKIEAKIKLAEERFAWSTFNEVGKVYVENKRSFEKCRAKFAKQEEKLDPIKEEIKEAGKKKATFDRRITELNGSLKDSTGKAKAHSSNIEKLELKVMQVDDEVEALETAEDKKKELIAREKNAIAEMEAEMSSTQDEGDIAPLCAEATRKVGVAVEAQQAKAKERDNLKYEQNHLRKQMDGRIDELRKLDDVEKMKLNKLKQLNSDAFEAVMWLRNNPGFFQHEVHEPLVMCANIHDVRNAKYIETCVNPRDMTSFFFASTDEMNRFLKICRNDRGWKKISAVTMPQKDLRDFVPHVAVSNLRNYDFISYVKDLVSVPDNVLSYLCHNYHLHRIPVFQAAADKFFDKFVNEMGFTKLFIGNYVHSVSGSLYSNAKSTMSKEVYSSRHLEIRKDDERETFLKNEIALYQEKLEKVETVLKQVEAAWQQCNLDLEAARKTKKELDQRRNYKSRQEGIIETKKKVLREMLAEVGSNRGREELKAKKKTLISQEVKSAQLLQVAIREANELRVKMEVVRLALQPLEEVHQKKTEELRESQDQMKGLKKELDSAEREFRVAKDTLTDAMKDAHKATGGYGSKKEEPPEEKKRQWEEEQIPSEHDEIQLYVGEMRARADCMESVDPRTIRDYNNTRENIQELQDDIQRRESRMTDKLNNLQTLKNAWVTSLTSLVSRISTNFSSHFQTMGFAGEVVLKTGDHENDFDNYGIRIRVKYRDSEPLQDLTPHHQSGGERSVATALYMLALQELTTVPFRCVDEINQGMDARNERLVFELLVKTSCHVSSAQYFLLTPKLLTGLNYSPRMNLLIVYNGHSMCHYTDWDMDKFMSCEE